MSRNIRAEVFALLDNNINDIEQLMDEIESYRAGGNLRPDCWMIDIGWLTEERWVDYAIEWLQTFDLYLTADNDWRNR